MKSTSKESLRKIKRSKKKRSVTTKSRRTWLKREEKRLRLELNKKDRRSSQEEAEKEEKETPDQAKYGV